MDFNTLLKLIILRKKMMFFLGTIFFLINIVYITFTDRLYESNAVVLPISSSSNPLDIGGASGLGGLLNLNLDSSQSTSFSPDVYPLIISSKKMSDKILNQNFNHQEKNQTLFAILSKDKSFKNDKKRKKYFDNVSKKLREKTIKVSHNQFTDIIKVSVSSLSPKLAKDLLVSIISETQLINDLIFAEKEKEKLFFLKSRLIEVKQEVETLDNELVSFMEKNRLNMNSPLLSLEKDKIERRLDIKKNVLISLTQQNELLTIQSKDNTSILYIMDPPSVPSKHSHPKTLLLSLFSIFIGSVVGFFIPGIIENYKKHFKNLNTI
tara:strand:- start:12227 stop:13192 length:966 start_codon:yes stop_codon:yes gene_type:complete